MVSRRNVLTCARKRMSEQVIDLKRELREEIREKLLSNQRANGSLSQRDFGQQRACQALEIPDGVKSVSDCLYPHRHGSRSTKNRALTKRA